ncbi:MAG: zinc ribbon domain-containing protein [Acidobacteriota bacterium]
MYCSFCGTALTPGLSFCNRCGAELNAKDRDATKPKQASQDSLVGAIVAVTIVGLGGLIGLMAMMKQALHFSDPLIIAFSLLFFLTFLGVDSVFIRLLLRSMSAERYPERVTQPRAPSTNELIDAKPRALSEPAASVTEHTTRMMDPVGEERQRR